MVKTEETRVPIVVNGDLPRKILALREDLSNCNADKAGVLEWARLMGK